MSAESSATAIATPQSACARCGAAFVCGAASGAARCWCVALPRLQNLLAFETCLCPACLESALKEETHAGISHSPGR